MMERKRECRELHEICSRLGNLGRRLRFPVYLGKELLETPIEELEQGTIGNAHRGAGTVGQVLQLPAEGRNGHSGRSGAKYRHSRGSSEDSQSRKKERGRDHGCDHGVSVHYFAGWSKEKISGQNYGAEPAIAGTLRYKKE